MQAGASLVTLELLFSLFVRSSRSAGSTALNQGAGFRSCVAFRSKGVDVSRHLFHAFLFPRSCKYFGILPLIGRAAAAFSATPARLGIKKAAFRRKRPYY